MRGHRSVLLFFCLFLVALLGLIPPRTEAFYYVHIWQVSFSGSLAVRGNESYPISTGWNYVGNSSWQTCDQLVFEMTTTNHTVVPTDLVTDSDNNPQLVLNITSPLPPQDVLSWRQNWRFTVADRRPVLPRISLEQAGSVDEIQSLIGADDYVLYTQYTDLWKTTNQTLIDVADAIRDTIPVAQQNNVLAQVCAVLAWIGQNVQRTTDLSAPQYPEELLLSRAGDCDDMSNLLIALLRILGMPSYLMTGHWFQDGARTSGYLWGSVAQDAYLFVDWRNVLGHGWAMVYVPPWGWLPFDLTADNVGSTPLNAYYQSLYAQSVPMVTLWQCISTDYVRAQRQEEADLFDYRLHRSDFEEWSTLGSIPILDLPYFVANAATVIALTSTLASIGCLVGIGMRRQPREENP
jgi:transglutaminase-like putative cysteine protease